jgi:hypothetical protein
MNPFRVQIDFVSNQMSDALKTEMWELYQSYYHYDKASFFARFEKHQTYAIYRFEGRLVGFTGLRINEAKIDGKNRTMIYFGQTVIEGRFRACHLIPRTGLKLMRKFWKQVLNGTAYCWADALTYRAYLVFAKNLRELYPSRFLPDLHPLKNLVDYLGECYYPDSYQPASGTICKTEKLVADTSVVLSEEIRARDADVRFYAYKNVHHASGHGLLTLAPLNLSNCLELIRRTIAKSLRPQRKSLIAPIPSSTQRVAA